MKTPVMFSLALLVAWIPCANLALAATVNSFVLDPDRSEIILAGTLVGVAAQEQAPGSLQSRLSGKLLVELSSETIHFPPADALQLAETGSWQPAPGGVSGSAPANFGAQASLGLLGGGVAAARQLELGIESPVPLELTDRSFNASRLLFRIPPEAEATLDYRVTGFLSTSGTEALGGYATNAVATSGTLVASDDLLTLTIPIDAEYLIELLTPGDSTLRVTGQLVATRPIGVVSPAIQPPVFTDSTITLTWSGGGELETSADLTHWTATGNQSGAFTEPLSASDAKFYRVRAPSD